MVRIQVLSDLHLELLHMSELWFKFYHIDCDVLCICGDIGNIYSDVFWSFINYARKKAQYVLLVTGNHDYWGNSLLQIDYDLKEKLGAFNNVFHLQKDVFFFGGYAFLGCTLWSQVPAQYWDQFERGFPDFSKIRGFSPFSMNITHNDHVEWLRSALAECKKQKLKPIVLTHYSPVFNISTSPRHKNSISQHMFSTDMSELFPLVHTWLFGHTHYDVTGHMFQVKDHSIEFPTMFITNQQGYPSQVSKHFNPGLTYDPDKTYSPKVFSQNWNPKVPEQK